MSESMVKHEGKPAVSLLEHCPANKKLAFLAFGVLQIKDSCKFCFELGKMSAYCLLNHQNADVLIDGLNSYEPFTLPADASVSLKAPFRGIVPSMQAAALQGMQLSALSENPASHLAAAFSSEGNNSSGKAYGSACMSGHSAEPILMRKQTSTAMPGEMNYNLQNFFDGCFIQRSG